MSINSAYHELTIPHRIALWAVIGIVIIGGSILAFGWMRDKYQQHEYEATRAADAKKASDAEAKAQQAVGVAQEAMKQRDQALEDAKQAHEQVITATKILNDASKTTAQKRQAYQDILDSAPSHVSSGDQSTDELCARAKQLGIDCDK